MFRHAAGPALIFALCASVARRASAQETQPIGTPRRPEQTTPTGSSGPPATRGDQLSPPTTPVPQAGPSGRFEFGSYGRVNVASDLRGRTGRDTDIVAHGSRVDDPSYAELELRREDRLESGIRTRIVTTLALFPPFFHFSGVAADRIAVRQLYVQAVQDDWTLWGGARMWRGDDIYLLNWWPLDNQNTVGGGVAKAFADTSLALHAGMQRLDLPSQFQQVPSPVPYAIGAANVVTLDRPRIVETAKATHLMRALSGPNAADGLKLVLYGEAHQMAAGVRRDVALQSQIPLPQDDGWLVGSQVVYFTGLRDTYASFVFRHARGLAVYDPLASPTSLALDKTTSGAHETLFAFSGNFEERSIGIQWGSYLRFLRSATASPTSLERYDEGILLVRPQWYVTEHVGIAVEGSYQARRYAILDPASDGPLAVSMWRGAILPYFSPNGRGAFARPHIGLVFAATARNDALRTIYPRDDPFSWRSSDYYCGVTVEWWFNMSSYP